MKTLADAFEHTLQDVYYAENAIVKALPKVITASIPYRRPLNPCVSGE
jgi:ferritin-like metal-binding protein YciE